MSIGEIMRKHREAAGLSREDVWLASGHTVFPGYQEAAEEGRPVVVRMDRFFRWCDAIGCKPEEVFKEIVENRT